MCYCNYLLDPGSRFAEIREQVTHGIIPEHAFANSAPSTIPFTIVKALAPRAELLFADQVRNVHFSSIGVPSILHGFKIVEYVQYSVAWRQHVLQWVYITCGQTLCSRCIRYCSAFRIRVLCPKRVRRMSQIVACAHRRISYFQFASYGWRNRSGS